jgi:hypothetical protein
MQTLLRRWMRLRLGRQVMMQGQGQQLLLGACSLQARGLWVLGQLGAAGAALLQGRMVSLMIR